MLSGENGTREKSWVRGVLLGVIEPIFIAWWRECRVHVQLAIVSHQSG